MSYSNDYYTTSDMALSAVLVYYNFPIESIKWVPSERKCYFNFKNDNKLKSIIESCQKHELKVEPLEFFYAIREVKSRIKNH